jgi:uncharacterized OsmC-like protein
VTPQQAGGEEIAMSFTSIRDAVHRTIKHLTEQPDKALSMDRPATAVIEEGLRCRVEGPGGWSTVTDMPKALGGGAVAPTPGWLSRAAQASCLATVISMRAAQEGVALGKLEVIVPSESDSRGLLGMDDSVPAGPLTSRTDVRIGAAGVAPERLREIVRWADGHSPVSDAIGRAIPRRVDIEAS